jgi:hypothetical protein
MFIDKSFWNRRPLLLGRIAKSEQTRDGLLAVLADHSTEGRNEVASDREGGEPMSKEPTVGKVKPGITFLW